MEIAFDLSVIWALIIAFAVFTYVVLDSFDLGLGILFPFSPEAGPLWRRLGWFVALWAAGVLAVGTVAYIIRHRLIV